MDDIYNDARAEGMEEKKVFAIADLLKYLDGDIERELDSIKGHAIDDEQLKFSLEKDIFDLLRLRRALVNDNKKEAAKIVDDMDTATRDMLNGVVHSTITGW